MQAYDEKEFLLYKQNRDILRKGSPAVIHSGCSAIMIFATEYLDFFLVTPEIDFLKKGCYADLKCYIIGRDD